MLRVRVGVRVSSILNIVFNIDLNFFKKSMDDKLSNQAETKILLYKPHMKRIHTKFQSNRLRFQGDYLRNFLKKKQFLFKSGKFLQVQKISFKKCSNRAEI